MRATLFLLPLLLAGCGSTVSQYEILTRSQAEINARESWSQERIIIVERTPTPLRMTWKVGTGVFDFSDFPSYKGRRLVPGTERELLFTSDGCLIGYSDATGRCALQSAPVQVQAPLFGGK